MEILKKILLPVDKSESSERAINFSLNFLNLTKKEIELTIFHVVSTHGYLSSHMQNIDLRVELLKQSEEFLKIKKLYVEKVVDQFMEEYAKRFSELKHVKITKKVVEGDPGNEILKEAETNDYSLIIIGRRFMSHLKEVIIGSVSSKIIYGVKNKSILLVGKEELKKGRIKVLLPVDGSVYSEKALDWGISLIKTIEGVEKITILKVINFDLFEIRVKNGIDPVKEAEEIVNYSAGKFLKNGIPSELINTKIKKGNPAEEIKEEIEKENYDLVIIGRKGRSNIKDLVLGGVSTFIIHKVFSASIVLMNV